MTWSYSGNPAASSLDQLRFVIGDTDPADQLLSDEELTWLIDDRGSATLGAPYAAEAIGAKLARESDSSKSVGDLSLSQSLASRSERFYKLADRLHQQAGDYDPPVTWGNTEALDPEFYVGQFDNIKSWRDDIV